MPPARLLPLVLLFAVLAGCGSTVQEGTELSVYVGGSQATLAAARQALADAGGEAGGAPVEIVPAEPAGGGKWEQAAIAAGARLATQDSLSIAYVGDDSGAATQISAPITNEAGLLQVTPGPVSRDLLAEPGGNDVPDHVQTTGERTLGALRIEGEPARGAASAYAYEAMAVVLDSIDRADDPLSRADVIEAFMSTRDRDSALGVYSVGADGAAGFAGG